MKILIAQQVYDDYAPEARIVAPGVTFLPYDDDDPSPAGLDEAEGILFWFTVRRLYDLLAGGRRLRWLHTGSAGVDGILPSVHRAGATQIEVTDSGPAFEISISEFVMAWILTVARRLPELQAQQRDGQWQGIVQNELWGRTIGIVGLGPIGRGVASRAKAFGMRTVGYRRRQMPVEHVDEVVTGPAGLERVLAECDYLVLAAALTDETNGLIGRAQLSQMKPTAWLLNIARGNMIDEDALIDALQSGAIAGACLDVFRQEPLPPDSPLWTMSNVYITPHNSQGYSAGTRSRQKQIFLDNLRRFVDGEPLQNIVDIARGY